MAFVIGSSHGLSEEVKKAAALKFSMGRITMPHQLARLVLTEQIYRACTINAGMKYHKENGFFGSRSVRRRSGSPFCGKV